MINKNVLMLSGRIQLAMDTETTREKGNPGNLGTDRGNRVTLLETEELRGIIYIYKKGFSERMDHILKTV